MFLRLRNAMEFAGGGELLPGRKQGAAPIAGIKLGTEATSMSRGWSMSLSQMPGRARESEAAVVRHMKGFIGGSTGSYLGDVAEKSDERAFAYEELVKDTVLHGSPDTVLRGLEALAAAGASSMMIHYPPYYGPSKTVKMLQLFAKEVLPHASTFEPGGAGAAPRYSH